MRIPDSQLSGLGSFDFKTLFEDFNKTANSVLGPTKNDPIIGIGGVIKPTTTVPTLLARPTTTAAPVVTAPTPVAGKSLLQSIGQAFADTAKVVLPAVQQALPIVIATEATVRNQKLIQKLQEQRLKAGQAPLTNEELSNYLNATAPAMKIIGGVDNNTSKYMMYGGIALGAGLLFMAMRNKG